MSEGTGASGRLSRCAAGRRTILPDHVTVDCGWGGFNEMFAGDGEWTRWGVGRRDDGGERAKNFCYAKHCNITEATHSCLPNIEGRSTLTLSRF